MNEPEEKKQSWLPILGLLALIVVLFLCIKLIFAGMEQMFKQPAAEYIPEAAQSRPVEQQTAPAPAFCPYCGEKLHDTFQWGQYCPYCGEKVEG